MTVLAATDQLSREAARAAAREELARRQYEDARPPLLVRVLGRLLEELAELLDRAAASAPGGRLGLVLLVGLLVAVVAVVLARVRPRRSGRGTALFGSERALTAADHRDRAERAAAAGQYADAVRERLRAVVRELEARGVLDPRPGRTADEVAREAGAVVPAIGEDLRRGVRVFGEVWYGGRPATSASYDVLVDVDRRVSQARLAAAR